MGVSDLRAKLPSLSDNTNLPFNIWVLTPDAEMVSRLRQVTSLDRMDTSGSNFHEDGLFSTSIFGRIGSEERDTTFGYIDLKMDIFHPELYLNLIKIKALYGGICSGKQYAVWDTELKDFVPANELHGQTGFSFFMQHYPELTLRRNASDHRDVRIDFVEKHRNAFLRYHLVSPAGLRDAQVSTTTPGQITEDEINDVYRKLITVSNTLSVVEGDENSAILDVPRWTMQYNAVLIYQMIKKMISGKSGWIQSKYGSRRTRNGTRNVITSMDTSAAILGSPNALRLIDTEIGFTQTLRGALPFTIHSLYKGLLGELFNGESREVWLTNPKTWRKELVTLSSEVVDSFTTRPGLERLINRFFVRSLRNKAVYAGSHYLGLIYVSADTFKVFTDISEFPSHLDKRLVRPITLSDLLFTSCYQNFSKLVGFITRYPVTGAGSTYPTTYKVRTTVGSTTKRPLDDSWQVIDAPEAVAYNFPDNSPDVAWLDSVSIHSARLQRLGADFDGDMVSTPIMYTEDVYQEVQAYFKTKVAYVDVDGSLIASASVHTVNLVVANLTGAVPA